MYLVGIYWRNPSDGLSKRVLMDNGGWQFPEYKVFVTFVFLGPVGRLLYVATQLLQFVLFDYYVQCEV